MSPCIARNDNIMNEYLYTIFMNICNSPFLPPPTPLVPPLLVPPPLILFIPLNTSFYIHLSYYSLSLSPFIIQILLYPSAITWLKCNSCSLLGPVRLRVYGRGLDHTFG